LALAAIGTNFLGALAYADDVVLLAPTPQAMRKLLQKCDEYAEDFSVIFNARKSKCIYYPGKVDTSAVSKTGTSTLPSFFIGGNSIDYVDKWPHLGHILNAALSDDDDVEHRRVQTVKKSMTSFVILAN
jgi:hypothetical protein